MPFQMRDETASQNILYVNDDGSLGLGSLPVSAESFSVDGLGVVNYDGQFSAGMLGPGAQKGYEGEVYVTSSASIFIQVSVVSLPSVAASTAPTSVSVAGVTFTGAPLNSTLTYSIW